MKTEQNLIKFAAATGNDIYDPEWENGSWMVEAVETEETIDDFVEASKNYNECSNPKLGEIAGFKFVSFGEVQVKKGDKRRALSVIDFGDKRFALNCDLTDYV